MEEEAAEIRRAVEGLLAGKKRREIVADFRARGVRTVGGGEWTERSLGRFVVRPRLAGLRVNANGELVEADWPAIITPQQHQALLALNPKPEGGKPHNTKPAYMLSGLLRCGYTYPATAEEQEHRCGKTLYTQPSTTITRGYVCRSGAPGYGCGRVRISGPAVEDMVGAAALAKLQQPAVIARLTRAITKSEAESEAALAELDRQEEDAAEQYARRELTMAQLKKITQVTKEQRAALHEQSRQRQRLTRLPDTEDLATWWVDASIEDRRELVSLVIDHVVVLPSPRRGNVPPDPSRLEFVWR